MTTIPHKLAWPIVGALTAFTTAILGHIFDLPAAVTILIAIVVGFAWHYTASRIVKAADMFDHVDNDQRTKIIGLILSSVVAHVGWTAAFAIRPDLGPIWIITLVAMVGLSYGVATAHEFLLTKIKPAEDKRAIELAEKPEQQDDNTKKFAHVLEAADMSRYRILRYEHVKDFGIKFYVSQPARRSIDSKGIKTTGKTNGLTPDDAENIAIAFRDEAKQPIHSSWVRIDKLPEAGMWSILLVNQDVMGRLYPYTDDGVAKGATLETAPSITPYSIHDLMIAGYGMDGEPQLLDLRQHGMCIGSTRGGKTSLIQTIIAYLTRCHDAVPWVCGTVKIYDLLAGWLEPYWDKDCDLPIDWVAFGPKHTAEMLAALMRIGRWRQAQPLNRRRGWPDIVCIMDEASFPLALRKALAEFENVEYTISQLGGMVVKGVGSAGIWIYFVSQRGTYDQLGDNGGEINANIGWKAVFKSEDNAEVGRAIGEYSQSDIPTHKGEFQLKTGNLDRPHRLKARYIQEVDPSKPKLHDGLTLSDVAVSRRHTVTKLDEGSARQAGPLYAKRHTRMGQAMFNYINGVDGDAGVAVAPSSPAPLSDPDEEVADIFDSVLGHLLLPAGSEEAPDEPVVAAATAVANCIASTRAGRVKQIIHNSDIPLRRGAIVEKLREMGDEKANPQMVTNALTKLVNDGEVPSPVNGTYSAPATAEATN